MWNFTVRGAIIPNCNGIQHHLNDPEMSQEPQKSCHCLRLRIYSLVCILITLKKECLGFLLSVNMSGNVKSV